MCDLPCTIYRFVSFHSFFFRGECDKDTDVGAPSWGPVPAVHSTRRGAGWRPSPRLPPSVGWGRTLLTVEEPQWVNNKQPPGCWKTYPFPQYGKSTCVLERPQASASDGCIQRAACCVEASPLLLTFEGSEERLLRCHVEPHRCCRCYCCCLTTLAGRQRVSCHQCTAPSCYFRIVWCREKRDAVQFCRALLAREWCRLD